MSVSKPLHVCSQVDCDAPSVFRYTWPGQNEAGICAVHAIKQQNICNAMGLYVQLIPLTPDDYAKSMGGELC